MKTLWWCTFWALLANTAIFGQLELTNGSFENWTGNTPDHWRTSNLNSWNTNNIVPVSPAYEGEYAVKGEVIYYPYTPGFPLIPLLESKTEEGGFVIDELAPALNLYYKFYPTAPGDVLKIFVVVQGEGGTFLGSGFTEISRKKLEFTPLSIPIYYQAELKPTQVLVSMTIDHNGPNDLPTIGSYFIVDEITMGDLVPSVNNPFPRMNEANKVYANRNSSDLNFDLQILKGQVAQAALYHSDRRQVFPKPNDIPNENVKDLSKATFLCRLSTFGGAMTKR